MKGFDTKMHLKGLKMQGFKSFADTIELNFSEGITAIVGPNGSGKSNISDAVRWVLGEQSAKTLRGSKMEDVIFNGTEARKRLGFAEVSLCLDNTDHGFRTDFDELTVTRKVYASGESQYFINDAPCRLKDIHEIFMDTGLGRDGYSMIGQGKIDEILSSKSEERREIFEEAAGISKYRYRKEEAERRLKHTDENLDRVSDIIAELETQIDPLTKQAEKAKQYLNLRDELKHYDVNAVLRTVLRSKEQSRILNEKIDAAGAQLTEVQKSLTEADEAQEACYKEFEELDASIAQTTEKRRIAEESIVVAEREIEVLKSTIEGNLRLVERVEKESSDLLTGKQEAEQNLRAQKEQLEKLEEALAAIVREKEELAAENADFKESTEEQNGEIENIKAAIQAAFDRSSESKIKLSNIDILEQNIKTQRRDMAAEIEEKEKELASQKEKGGGMLAEHARKEEFLSGLAESLSEIREREKALEEKLNQHLAQIQELTQKTAQKKTRLHLLTEMEQSFEGYYKSVKEVMKQHASGMLRQVGIHGPVSKLIHVDKQYATAIGAAIGGSLQNIVVDSEEDAKKSITCLKQLGAGRATFMPISAVSGSLLDVSRLQNEAGYVGLAAELVSFDACYQGIVHNLLGKTVVMDTMDRAIAVSRKYKQSLRVVTLAGEIFYPGGSISGGSEQKGNQLLGREQEIEALKDSVLANEHTLKQMEKGTQSLESEILEVASEREKLQSVYNENKEVLLVLARDREHHDLLLSSLSAAVEALKKTLDATESEAQRLTEERKAAAAALQLQHDSLPGRYRSRCGESPTAGDAVGGKSGGTGGGTGGDCGVQRPLGCASHVCGPDDCRGRAGNQYGATAHQRNHPLF